MDILTFLAVLSFAVGAVLGFIFKDWVPGLVSLGLLCLTLPKVLG